MAEGADKVINNMRSWADRQRAAVVSLAQNWAGQLEARAKRNAPWTDRTGNARNGLFGSTEVTGLRRNEVKIRLAHTMDYGVFLELARDGKYAILKPTVDAAVPEIWESYRNLWE